VTLTWFYCKAIGMNNDFESVIHNEGQKIFGLSFRLTRNQQEAEDLCQEALMKALKSFHNFEGRSQVSTWLYRIVINTWKNNMRKKRRVTFFGFFRSEENSDSDDQALFHEPKGNDPPVEAGMEKAESEQMLSTALSSLTQEEREIIVLRDLEDKSYEELAEILNVPMGTIKSRLARARETLRHKLIPMLKATGEFS
jgi:RNA polymerase sigma-70 factor, ECF subfamily